MSRHIILQPYLTSSELEQRYRAAKEPNERSWWQILWLLSQDHTGREVATVTGYSPYWIGQIAKRYNSAGPDGMRNRRHATSHRAPPALDTAQQEELRAILRQPSRDESAGRATMWQPGSASGLAARSPTRWGMPTCSGSSTASNCPGRSTCRPIQQRRKRSKKDMAAAA
jgi:Homeodomain-like domain-containing protein